MNISLGQIFKKKFNDEKMYRVSAIRKDCIYYIPARYGFNPPRGLSMKVTLDEAKTFTWKVGMTWESNDR